VKIENGRSRGVGFVRFASSVDAMKAKQEMDGRIWSRNLVHVEVVQRKEKHQAHLPHQTKGTITPSTHQVPHAIPVVKSAPAVHTVPVVDNVPAVDIAPVVDSVPAIDTVPSVESVPVVVPAAAAVSEVSAPTQAPDEDEAPFTPVETLNEVQQEKETTVRTNNVLCSQDVLTYPPPGKWLMIYMLESAPLEDQIQMAHDYMLPLIEEIHPTQAQ
ncbi:hypothetical protein QTP70_016765, partial [Hemibagrus guttatus]